MRRYKLWPGTWVTICIDVNLKRRSVTYETCSAEVAYMYWLFCREAGWV